MGRPPSPLPASQPPVPHHADLRRLDSDRRTARATLVLLLFALVWFAQSDFRILPDDWTRFVERATVRLAAVALTVWGILRLRRTADRLSYERVVFAVSVGSAACVLALNALRPYGGSLSMRAPMLWLLAFYGGLALPLRRQFIAPVAYTVGLILLRVTWSTSGVSGDVAGDMVVLVLTNVMGGLVAVGRERSIVAERSAWTDERSTRESLDRKAEELHRLQGAIPVCTHCRELSGGTAEWAPLANYVRDRSEVAFAHGICPSCAEKYLTPRRSAEHGVPSAEPRRQAGAGRTPGRRAGE